MKLNHINHIFFDLDHTLWDFDKNSRLTFEKVFDINKIQINLDEFLEVYEPINFQYWKLYRENQIDKKKLRYNRLKDTFKILKIEVKSSTIYKLSKDYIIYLENFNYLFDQTTEVLNYLKPNYKLHIITNGFKEVQHRKLNKSGIDHFFETVTNSEMIGVKKPNPKIFKHALKMAKADITNSIMIGDNYETDILGALNIGMDAICYNYHKEDFSDQIKQIKNLTELQNYF